MVTRLDYICAKPFQKIADTQCGTSTKLSRHKQVTCDILENKIHIHARCQNQNTTYKKYIHDAGKFSQTQNIIAKFVSLKHPFCHYMQSQKAESQNPLTTQTIDSQRAEALCGGGCEY